jgi:hypothetical protein
MSFSLLAISFIPYLRPVSTYLHTDELLVLIFGWLAFSGLVNIVSYKYFSNEVLVKRYLARYKGLKSKKEIAFASNSIGFLYAWCALTGVALASQNLYFIFVCIGIFITLEFWARKRFF